ncbi:hypothetical protein MPL1032_190012 [Mesorhizobium plurifarium]|uniref:Uncharacterized protein n=1 Tax=Mesorhizobium plurifarium TaxID=69974 RepID=A0A0K2VUI8_MESPL|nr:hypothetical protein MPL1032_190012 [Mesorhizobium plurifarium]
MLGVPQLHHGAERHLREVRHVWIDERVQLISKTRTQHYRPGRKIGPICLGDRRAQK